MKQLRAIWFCFLVLLISLSTGSSILIVREQPIRLSSIKTQPVQAKEAEEIVAMLFVGDVMLGRDIAYQMMWRPEGYPLQHMPSIIEKMEQQLDVDKLDLVVGNVEGPVSDANYVNPGTAMRFNFKPDTAEFMADWGFTTASMANNHALDQGEEHFEQTYQYLTAAGIGAFGHPDTHKGPYSFLEYEFEGHSIGFLGLNDAVYSLDEEGALEQIQKYDSQVDFLIIGIHWGIEYEATARPHIQEFAHQMVDAGADFIWGHHPHVIQNQEIYKGAPIYYSLGNFVFDQYWSSETQRGLVVGLKLEEGQLVTTEFEVQLVSGEPQL